MDNVITCSRKVYTGAVVKENYIYQLSKKWFVMIIIEGKESNDNDNMIIILMIVIPGVIIAITVIAIR